MTVSVRPARNKDRQAISTLLTEAADWQQLRGDPLANASELSADEIAADIGAAVSFLVLRGDELAAIFGLRSADPPLWSDVEAGQALYLEKIVVGRRFAKQGLPLEIVAWCAQQVLLQGKRFLRAQIALERPKLRKLFQELGFQSRPALPSLRAYARYELVLRATVVDELTANNARILAAHALRVRRVVESPQGARLRVDGRENILHFGSNDYLGLANDARVREVAKRAIDAYGVGAGASHLISGHFLPHQRLEQELAQFVGGMLQRPRALLFSTGYMASLGTITALLGRGDAVFADRLNHACLNDAALLSRATLSRYPHLDLVALEKRLESSRAKRKLIVTDGVFSMDGDIAPLPQLLALANQHDAWLLVDDAHGFGILGEGRGSLAHYGLGSALGESGRGEATKSQLPGHSERLLYMGTLGKAAGGAGAFICADDTVIEWLIQTARTYMFTTAGPPAIAEALRASLAIIRDEPERRAHVETMIKHLRRQLDDLPWRLLKSATPIQPLMVGDNATALEISNSLWARGIWVPAIRPPTVAPGTSRLRITLTALHTKRDVDFLVSALHAIAFDLKTQADPRRLDQA